MLKFALQSVKNFPKFVRGLYEIVIDFVGELASIAGDMKLLAAEGVMLLKGTIEGEGVAKYFLSFYGNVIRGGTIEEIKKTIDYIFKRAKGRLQKYIAEVLTAKMLRYVRSGGQRGEIPLTSAQIEEITEYALKYGIAKSDIHFSEDVFTGYKLLYGVKDWLYIGTDVMPGLKATGANGKLSWKSAVAHELEGHRAAELAGKTQDKLLYEEVQASMRASLYGKDLTAAERELLRQDAIARLLHEEPGTILDDILDQLWLEKF